MEAPANSLLFLRHVHTIELFSKENGGRLKLEASISIANHSTPCRSHGLEFAPVAGLRRTMVEALKSRGDTTKTIEMCMVISVFDAVSAQPARERRESWFVEHRIGHPDLAEMPTASAARICAGIAVNIETQVSFDSSNIGLSSCMVFFF